MSGAPWRRLRSSARLRSARTPVIRASIAASLLDRAGRTVVLIDDDWTSAQRQLGLTMAEAPQDSSNDQQHKET